MPDEKRFDVRLDPDALKEYNKLDNSILGIVNKQIDELAYRADEVGKMLENKNSTKLAGCREIKLKDMGIRIVYRITNETVEVLQILYILTGTPKWVDKKNPTKKKSRNNKEADK